MSTSGWQTAATVGGDLLTTGYNNRKTDERFNEAADLNQQMYATRYQTQVKDLQAAGLNPMLAYGQSPGSGPQMSPAQTPVSKNLGQSINETRIASAQEAKIHAETANTRIDTINKAMQPEILAGTASSLQEQVKKLQKEIILVDEQISQTKQNINKTKSDIEVNKTIELLNQKKAMLTEAETRLVTQTKTILDPKEAASKTPSAKVGHGMEYFWKAVNPFHNFMSK